MIEFLSMGGYGFYVWGAYAVTFVLLAIEVVLLRRRGRTARVSSAKPGKTPQGADAESKGR